VNVDCVQFGIEVNNGDPFNVRINLYIDTNGNAPTAPGDDLVLLATSANIFVPVGEHLRLRVADFSAAPVNVGIDQVLVVELEQDDRYCLGGATGDCGGIWPGSNDLGQTADSYIRSTSCGLNNYATFASIGFPEVHLTQTVVLSQASSSGCVEDCALPSDGCVDAVDFFQLIGAWGLCNSGGAPCP
jgi:hypothetical protein